MQDNVSDCQKQFQAKKSTKVSSTWTVLELKSLFFLTDQTQNLCKVNLKDEFFSLMLTNLLLDEIDWSVLQHEDLTSTHLNFNKQIYKNLKSRQTIN